jgi:predicted Zn-dependent protease with MMP-like domain
VDPGWLRLAARLAYRAADISAAADFAQRALSADEDAPTWNLLGRLGVWLDRKDAVVAFRRAAELRPEVFLVPYRVKRDRFTRMAEVALAAIPETFQEQLTNTMIVVDDLPDLDAVRDGEDPDLLGLYEGATVLEHGLPERIVLYQRNHENIVADEQELAEQVRETMRHEVGHHFGMEEDELPY